MPTKTLLITTRKAPCGEGTFSLSEHLGLVSALLLFLALKF
ncbi:hypothetical protein LINPERPRIM_LOCUS12769 [Linum perenne]